MDQIYSALDVYVFPSLFDGPSVALVEAQASGLSWILSDRLPREVQVNENCKFLSIDNGVYEWVEVILNQPKVDRVALSRHFVESKFNIKKVAKCRAAFCSQFSDWHWHRSCQRCLGLMVRIRMS